MQDPSSYLLRLQGTLEGSRQVFDLEPGVYTLGSARGSALILPHESVSRSHARLTIRGTDFWVEDLASTNGTFADGQAVHQGKVRAQTRIRFGRVRFEIQRIERDDARLAIALGRSPEDSPREQAWTQPSTRALGTEAAPSQAFHFPDLSFPPDYLPGRTPPMLALYREMMRLRRGDLPVLILGETGTGKEWIARILHGSSSRRKGPFLAINCAAIPAELLEAEMFGIAKGIATGVDPRRGKIEQASGGTLLLDEIGEMPPALQAKLLRALQEKKVHPLGGSAKAVDTRILSATHVDVDRALEEKTLRADLFYRLAGGRLWIPPLRERREDIPDLVEHFLRSFARKSDIHPYGLSVAALGRLEAHSWPGNVRQLEHEVRRLVYAAVEGAWLGLEQLSISLRQPLLATHPLEEAIQKMDSLDLKEAVRVVEDSLIRSALERSRGNKSQAARILGLSRNGLKRKLQRLGFPATKS